MLRPDGDGDYEDDDKDDGKDATAAVPRTTRGIFRHKTWSQYLVTCSLTSEVVLKSRLVRVISSLIS